MLCSLSVHHPFSLRNVIICTAPENLCSTGVTSLEFVEHKCFVRQMLDITILPVIFIQPIALGDKSQTQF